MSKVLKGLIPAAAVVAVMALPAVAGANHVPDCTADSPDRIAKSDADKVPGSDGGLGAAWVAVTDAPNSGYVAAENDDGTSYVEYSAQQDLTSGGDSASQSVRAQGPTGYVDFDGAIDGTTVSGSEDAATTGGIVSGSGDFDGSSFSDLEVNPAPGCLTPIHP